MALQMSITSFNIIADTMSHNSTIADLSDKKYMAKVLDELRSKHAKGIASNQPRRITQEQEKAIEDLEIHIENL